MAKHDVVIEMDVTPGFTNNVNIMATFVGTIDNVPISGEIRFVWKVREFEHEEKAIYTIKSTNKLFTQHPDYRDIRRQILQIYKEARGGSLANAAEEAIKR